MADEPKFEFPELPERPVCIVRDCANLAYDRVTLGGCCDAHANVAIVHALENLGGYLEELVGQADAIARAVEKRMQ